MKFEQSPNQEFSEKEQALIVQLREKGPQDSEVMAMLVSWCEAEEARAMEINTSRANIDVQLKRAKLYRAAGGYDVAWETLAAVCETAGSDESAQDLYREAMDIADEMRRTSEERSEIK